jgi:hypothetical protein
VAASPPAEAPTPTMGNTKPISGVPASTTFESPVSGGIMGGTSSRAAYTRLLVRHTLAAPESGGPAGHFRAETAMRPCYARATHVMRCAPSSIGRSRLGLFGPGLSRCGSTGCCNYQASFQPTGGRTTTRPSIVVKTARVTTARAPSFTHRSRFDPIGCCASRASRRREPRKQRRPPPPGTGNPRDRPGGTRCSRRSAG